jgi:hypothetical protein
MKLNKNSIIRLISITILLTFPINLFFDEKAQGQDKQNQAETDDQLTQKLSSYQEYINKFNAQMRGTADIFIPGTSFSSEKKSGVKRE